MGELGEVEDVRRGIKGFVKGEKIESIVFCDKVEEGKGNDRERIVKGMEVDSFKGLSRVYRIVDIEGRSKYIVLYLEKDGDKGIEVGW
uniref:DNA-formamidopyrimidine glycosylase family protein n=1 Tax=Staphylococcus saprophyticus TaxID=29385 RepID=UPI0028CB781B